MTIYEVLLGGKVVATTASIIDARRWAAACCGAVHTVRT